MNKPVIFVGRNNPDSVYAANRLFDEGVISIAIIEEKLSFKNEFRNFNFKKNIFKLLHFSNSRFNSTQHRRIFGSYLNVFNDKINLYKVSNVISTETIELINYLKAKLVISLGVDQLSSNIFKDYLPEWININWGNRIFYRSNGVILPIYKRNWEKVGFTIHKIDIDNEYGSNFCNDQIIIDESDDFNSICSKMTRKAIDYLTNGLIVDDKLSIPKNFSSKNNIQSSDKLNNFYYLYILFISKLNLFSLGLRLRFSKKIKPHIKSILGSLSFPFIPKSPQVFLYHEVTDKPSSFAIDYSLSISTKNFIKQLNWISKRYSIVDPIDLLNNPQIKGRIGKMPAILTFDDGNLSVFKFAAPILRRLSLKAILFINMAPIQGEMFWAGLVHYLCNNDYFFQLEIENKYHMGVKNYLYVTKDDIELYANAAKIKNFENNVRQYYGQFSNLNLLKENKDVFIYSNHLYNHYNATTLNEIELKEQIIKNKRILNQLKANIEFFAYPFGQPISCYNNITNSIVLGCGVKKIFYSNPGINKSLDDNFFFRTSPDNYFSNGYMKYISSVRPFFIDYLNSNRFDSN